LYVSLEAFKFFRREDIDKQKNGRMNERQEKEKEKAKIL